jgi:hypothetical protein
MFFECHVTDEEILKELTDKLNKEKIDFERWNSTSISHLFIILTNHNGKECQELGTQLIKKFLLWYEENKEDRYSPSFGSTKMYSLTCLENIVYYVENHKENQKKLCKLINQELKIHEESNHKLIYPEKHPTIWFSCDFVPYIVGAFVGGIVGGGLILLIS